MQIYLTEEEIIRERNLFEPHEKSYKLLEGVTFDIRSLKEPEPHEKATEEGSSESSTAITFVPPSC